MSASFARRYRFFREHGGGVIGEDALCAFNLARAELEAEKLEFVATWEPDCEEYLLGDGEEQPNEVWGCIVVAPSGEQASLWGIADPTRAYSRVIEAELALEVCEQIRYAQQNDAGAHSYQAL